MNPCDNVKNKIHFFTDNKEILIKLYIQRKAHSKRITTTFKIFYLAGIKYELKINMTKVSEPLHLISGDSSF